MARWRHQHGPWRDGHDWAYVTVLTASGSGPTVFAAIPSRLRCDGADWLAMDTRHRASSGMPRLLDTCWRPGHRILIQQAVA